MNTTIRIHSTPKEGYTWFWFEYPSWDYHASKPFRIVNGVVCYDMFSEGRHTRNDVPNGTMISIEENMMLIQHIIPQRFNPNNLQDITAR
jgi:hypothetical protein